MSVSPESLEWKDLVALEPALAELEAEIRSSAPAFLDDSEDAWYGRNGRPGFKARMRQLVGWSRRSPEWWTPGPSSPEPRRLDDLLRQLEEREPVLVGILAEDIANGREILWSSEAYALAYKTLYDATAVWDLESWSGS